MDFFTSPDLWIAFLTLFALELILGIDNVVFISILCQRLPEALRRRARIIGLTLAMVMRIGLLFAASWIIGLTDPIFSIGGAEVLQFSGRDLILIIGGLFLVYKAVNEIHDKLEGAEHHAGTKTVQSTFAAVIVQILLIDAVFSLDSVITAVGMVDELYIMVAAVVLSIGLMMILAGKISDFVSKHPTVKMLALSFLVLIGASLIAEGFDVHVEKAVIYGPIAFAIIVEVLNLTYRNRQARQRAAKDGAGAPDPVHLRLGRREPEAETDAAAVAPAGPAAPAPSDRPSDPPRA